LIKNDFFYIIYIYRNILVFVKLQYMQLELISLF